MYSRFYKIRTKDMDMFVTEVYFASVLAMKYVTKQLKLTL